MGIVRTFALPVSALLTGIVSSELAVYTYRESNVNDFICLFAVPFSIFIGAQAAFLLRRNSNSKPAGANNFFAGLAFAYIYRVMLDLGYAIGFKYTFSLGLALETAGIMFSLVITEFITGRKIRMERNALIVLTTVIALAGFYVKRINEPESLILFSMMVFIIFSIVSMLKYIIAISQDPVITLFMGSGTISILTLYDYHQQMACEYKAIVDYMTSNVSITLTLYFTTLASVLTNFLMFRYSEIDIIFIFKCLHLVVHVVCSFFNLISSNISH